MCYYKVTISYLFNINFNSSRGCAQITETLGILYFLCNYVLVCSIIEFFITDNALTESDVRILNIVLAEYLPMLKDSGLNLNQEDHPHITKDELVMHLEKINDEFAKILSESKGKISSIKMISNLNDIV